VDLYLSLPAVIGRGGVERVLNLPLNEQETEALRKSAAVLSGVLDELERQRKEQRRVVPLLNVVGG